MFKLKKFIETINGGFINIDYIVAIKKSEFSYNVRMCDGLWYELNNYVEAENLFEYLKGQIAAEFEPQNHIYD